MNVYSVFDKKVATYGQPFFALNDLAAARMVSMASMDRNSLLRCFPEDYQLERLGSFDEDKGELKSIKPHVVGPVASFIVDGGDLGEEESGSESSSPPWENKDKKAS